MSEERLMILKMIQDGKISPEQGESLLKALPSDGGGPERTPPPPPPPPVNPTPHLGSFFDLQGRLADVQVKLGELQSKLGAATSASASTAGSSPKGTVLPFGLGEVNVGQMIDEAVKGVNSLKSESVKTFKQAARSAQKEGRRIRHEAKKSGKNIRIELNINFEDDGRPQNESDEPETVVNEEMELRLENGRFLKIINRLGDVKVSSGPGNEALLKFTRTAWSDNQEELLRLNKVRPQIISNSSGDVEQIVVDTVSDDVDSITLDIDLILPESIVANVVTTFGSVACENRSGGAGRVETQSGDVRMLNIRGDVADEGTIRTRSGSISISQWDGPAFSAESVSGGISIDGVAMRTATVRSRSGELVVGNLRIADDFTVDTSSSDITVRHSTAGKDLSIRTQSGDVLLTEFSATTIIIESVSGDVGLDDIKVEGGGMSLKSVSGDIQTKKLNTEQLSSTTISGDVELAFVGPFAGSINASTISGDLELSLMNGSDIHVELSTQTGAVSSKLSLDKEVLNGLRFISGDLGLAKGVVTLQSVSGDVTIKPQA